MPAVQFVTTSDGVRIAYSVHGHGPPIVVVRGWFSHLELMWSDPHVRAWFEALGRTHTVVRFDCRGNGLSDREIGEPTLDGLVADVEAVVTQLKLGSFALFAMGYGGPPAIAFAARHPDVVTHLALFCTFASGLGRDDPRGWAAFLNQLGESPDAAMVTLSSHGSPHTPLMPAEVVRRLRQTAHPATALALYELALKIDTSSILPAVSSPTLVMHPRSAVAIPMRLGREVAAAIPSARFVALEGSSFNPWQGDVVTGLRELGQLLGAELAVPQSAPTSPQGLLTILFTDMESSTAITHERGDEAAQELLRRHNTEVRAALRASGGREVKHTGDGILATFASAARALECAIDIQRRLTGGEAVRVRVGINAGEPVAEDDDLFGAAIQVAARITSLASPGQILVSDVVRQLSAGKRFSFVERGQVRLRGVGDKIRLHELDWASV